MSGELPYDLDPDAFARVLISLFLGFVLQRSWDDNIGIEPYVAVVEDLVRALLEKDLPTS